MTASDFASFSALHVPRIEAELDRLLSLSSAPERLCEAMRYSALFPGKRFRPLLALMAAETCGVVSDDALIAGCAVELVHVFSLIHDDLPAMDDDDIRRGRPSNHKVYGEAEAILAGDALLAQAFTALTELSDAALGMDCVRLLAEATGAAGMCGGQSLDMAATATGLEALEDLHSHKTGALLTAALEMGVVTTHASEEERKTVKTYGHHVGLLYQITDDLLDLSSSAEIGKTSGKDAEQKKKTFVTVLGESQAKVKAEEHMQAALDALQIFEERASLLREFAQLVRDRTA